MSESRIEVWDGNKRLMVTMGHEIPKGATFREAYSVDCGDHMEFIICGHPETENHNCDMMGCSSVSHVLYRCSVSKGHL
jgi:hypothetical protein